MVVSTGQKPGGPRYAHHYLKATLGQNADNASPTTITTTRRRSRRGEVCFLLAHRVCPVEAPVVLVFVALALAVTAPAQLTEQRLALLVHATLVPVLFRLLQTPIVRRLKCPGLQWHCFGSLGATLPSPSSEPLADRHTASSNAQSDSVSHSAPFTALHRSSTKK
uniref:Uncharacterized protein n=1 Tax=Anopheles farauti TaxID=69004 RepID=A0A182QA28_9DIPT